MENMSSSETITPKNSKTPYSQDDQISFVDGIRLEILDSSVEKTTENFQVSSETHEQKRDCKKQGAAEIKPFKCKICDYETAVKGNLKKHVDSVHEEIKPFKCNICVHESSTKGNLKRHIENVHERIKPFKCNFCDYKSARKANLNEHVESAHGGIKAESETERSKRGQGRKTKIANEVTVIPNKYLKHSYVPFGKDTSEMYDTLVPGNVQKYELDKPTKSVHEGQSKEDWIKANLADENYLALCESELKYEETESTIKRVISIE